MRNLLIKDISAEPPKEVNKKKTKEKIPQISGEIGELVRKVYAGKEHSVLVVLQGMDASGKSSAVRHVFSQSTPEAIHHKSFTTPTKVEMAHDFLWRVHKEAPVKGHVSIFNRSHYEDILIQRVHNWIDDSRVKERMKAINCFEELLMRDNNTLILKFYLHVTKDRQEQKLKERTTKAHKYWKHNPVDWEERKYWDQYMKAYEDVINHSKIPWYIIPSNKKWYKNYSIANIVKEELERLNLRWPPLQNEKN